MKVEKWEKIFVLNFFSASGLIFFCAVYASTLWHETRKLLAFMRHLSMWLRFMKLRIKWVFLLRHFFVSFYLPLVYLPRKNEWKNLINRYPKKIPLNIFNFRSNERNYLQCPYAWLKVYICGEACERKVNELKKRAGPHNK